MRYVQTEIVRTYKLAQLHGSTTQQHGAGLHLVKSWPLPYMCVRVYVRIE